MYLLSVVQTCISMANVFTIMNSAFIIILVLEVYTSNLYGAPVFISSPYTCYKDSNPYWGFATKSPYTTENRKFVKPAEKGCKASQIIMIARHGTRSPTYFFNKKQTTELTKLKEKLTATNAKLCTEDVATIKSWENAASNDKSDKDLNEQGVLDMIGLGTRIRKSFPELLNPLYTIKSYEVLTAEEPRCKASAQYFMQSLLNNYNLKDKYPEYKANDIRLNLYHLQSKIANKDEIIKRSNDEVELFVESEFMKRVITNVSYKMGLPNQLNYDNIRTMYESCRSDKCRLVKSIPAWCRVFCKRDLETLEYTDDLYWYNVFGYGSPSYRSLICPMLKNIREYFREQANRAKGHTPKGVFYFSHRGNIINAIVMLGLGAPGPNEEHLRHDNFEKVYNRNWRTSFFSPFGANVIGVYYKCNTDDQVAFYINEQIVKIKLDNGTLCDICSWKMVEQKMNRILSEAACDFVTKVTNQ